MGGGGKVRHRATGRAEGERRPYGDVPERELLAAYSTLAVALSRDTDEETISHVSRMASAMRAELVERGITNE